MPGPWRRHKDYRDKDFIVKEDGFICRMSGTHKEEDIALIEAAPELRDALIDCYKELQCSIPSQFVSDTPVLNAKEIIEKATGLSIKEVLNNEI